ncbi:hypothetical protein Kpol_1014p8 [Vanderwaltozyma polyspora DSM 70294]|uniref:non-specific serine/threonine protein kinase n=1 Tax=Vanderwaltozyma polyspora (strain ATCC 22028 / DSM 70294 / BCRC 21397 / CBS 2163 / NBRC 10782 / NRRL Y-8283 / UCD 57-17) TaxID=436907 RepID=A7TND7_VANPO|nr:uncharacterized protein Kpol_1014p8 [Vanderwaltozyma polyspora DSM 70294]EDO16190.1 hypothetical protein Kpol_1014p8 [Vanderwaltozyma polyspora DSM 70294]
MTDIVLQPVPKSHSFSSKFARIFGSKQNPTIETNIQNIENDSNSNYTPSNSPSPITIDMPVSSAEPSTPTSNQCNRFALLQDGSHQHLLRGSKRQEKLSFMVKKFMSSDEKIRGQAKSAIPPSLLNNFISQINNKEHPSPQITPVNSNLDNATSMCFAQKYGSCKEVIGKGAYGIVRICSKKDNITNSEKLFAVKEFTKKSNEPYDKYSKRLTSEFCISSSLNHTNIIKTYDLFQDSHKNYFEVMEFCPGGDLFTLIVAAGKLEYAEADCFFKQIVKGVVYMQEMGVSHRDLKPENILLTSDGIIKIVDFGNSECFRMAWEKDIHLSDGICGSSPYIAPEEYIHEEFDPRPVDIWSCAVIYMAMRSGRQLWNSANKDDEFYAKYLVDRKSKGGFEPIESLKRARCRNVIYSMLEPVPHRRLTGKQILNSEWVREINCCTDSLTSSTSSCKTLN